MKDYWRFLRTYVRDQVPDVVAGITLATLYTLMALVMPLLTRSLIDDVLVRGNGHLLGRMVILMIGVLTFSSLLVLAFNAILVRTFQRIGFVVKTTMYRHLHQLDLSTLNDMPPGLVTYRLFGDTEVLQNSLGRLLLNFTLNSFTFLAVAGVMFWLNWRLAAFVLMILLLQVPVIWLFRQPLLNLAGERKKESELLNARVVEVFSVMPLLRACGAEKKEAERFWTGLSRVLKVALRESLAGITAHAITGTISGIVSFCILWYGGLQVIDGNLTLGSLMTFLLVSNMLSNPINSLTTTAFDFQDIRASTKRFYDMLGLQARVTSPPDAIQPVLEGRVEFDGVAFSYSERAATLRNVTFSVPAHSIVSIVGRSGIGKTTICSLLLRFYDPVSGVIRVDGHDLRKLDIAAYRRQVGMVMQNSFLISGTVRENILLGKPDATTEEVERVAEMANAHEFISRLPDGYWTQVGDRGTRLSGGESQRIALARLFLQQPRIVILDEATSFVDLESEERIQDAIRRLAHTSTVIIITHKLSTAKLASHIVVLDDGTVAEQGSHAELVAREGVYTRLYRQVLA